MQFCLHIMYPVSALSQIKIITKLSTEHVHTVSRVPVRIVLLVDRSGSMLHKLGRDARDAKITKVRIYYITPSRKQTTVSFNWYDTITRQ